MGRGTLGEVRGGEETLREVRDGLMDPRGVPKRVGRLSKRSKTGRGTAVPGRVTEVQDGSGPSGRSGTGRETHGEVQDGSRDHWGGPGWVGGPL